MMWFVVVLLDLLPGCKISECNCAISNSTECESFTKLFILHCFGCFKNSIGIKDPFLGFYFKIL